MPIYEYECTQCGKIEEALQKFSDKPLKKCRHCSGKLHKLVSQSSFHLKGTGWYVTDYTNRSQTASASSESKAEKPSTKPEKKTSPGDAGAASKTTQKAAG
jgi:putative FmdB family regulatory protein